MFRFVRILTECQCNAATKASSAPEYNSTSGPVLGGGPGDVKLSRQPSFCKGLFHDIEAGGKPFGQTERDVRDEPAHVVDEGEEVRLPHPSLMEDLRAVERVGLPQVVRQLRFEPPPVDRRRLTVKTVAPEKASHSRVAHPLRYNPSLLRLFHEDGKGDPRQ